MILSAGQLISERYEVIERIGSGGMSIVYRAKDTKLDRYVTFKVLREEHLEDEEFVERFSREARSVASLSHPNIVNVYDVGNDRDINYIVMEYIDGLTLKQLINKKAPFGDEEILGVAIQITDALIHAHENGIIHRDIKPQNILVTQNGAIKVTDFGIARMASSNTVSVGESTMGSVHYFSPEQAQGGHVDEKSDLYSLGILMYEMATAEIPFDGESPVQIALKHINEPLPRIREKNDQISKNLDNIIIKLTQKKSIDRYENGYALSSALKNAILRSFGNSSEDDFRREISNTLVLSGKEFNQIKEEARRLNNEPIKRIESQKVRSSYAVQHIPKPKKELEDFYEIEEYDDDYDNYYDEDIVDSNRSKEKRVIFYGIISGALLALAVAFIIWSVLREEIPRGVDIPNVIGAPFEQAKEMFYLLDVELVEIPITSNEIEKGIIIDQQFEGENLLYDEVKVMKVSVSKGRPTRPLPNFQNMSKEEAVYEAEILGFKVDLVEGESKDIPIDYIISYEPSGGEAEIGSTITMYVNSGKDLQEVQMPDLRNMLEDDAKAEIQANGLIIGNPDYVESASIEKGVVISQLPPAGSTILERSVVKITVSKGVAEEIDIDIVEPNVQLKHITIYEDLIPNEFLEELEFIRVQIARDTDDGRTVIYDDDIDLNNLPHEIEITGTGEVIYIILINGLEAGEEYINFDE